MPALALQNPPSTTALTDNSFATSRWGYVASSAALTEPREQAFTISSGGSSYRVVHRHSSLPAWVEPTITAFVGIQNLRDNWDSYGSKAVNNDLIRQSLSTLGLIMHANFPPPSIVPIGGGGIQMEWHRKQQDLEVVFLADDEPQFYYKNRATGIEQEGLASETAKLIHLLGEIA